MGPEQLPALRRRVEAALDRLRPALIVDGGNLELLEVTEDGTARVVFQGNCVHCPAQAATLREALEPALRAEVPEIVAIVPETTEGPALPNRRRPRSHS